MRAQIRARVRAYARAFGAVTGQSGGRARYFRAVSDGTVVAPQEAWEWLSVYVSKRMRADERTSGRRLTVLHDFVDAAEAAATLSATRVVPVPEAPPRAPESVWLTTEQAARRMGCTSRHVRYLARADRIPARRVGRAWLIEGAHIDRTNPRG